MKWVKKFWTNHNLALYLAERIKLPISRNKSQYGLIDTSREMEMPTHTRKSQNKQLGTYIPLQPLNSSITFYYTGNALRSKMIIQSSGFFHQDWYVRKSGYIYFCENVCSDCAEKNLDFFFLFKAPQPYQGMICFFNLPIWSPLVAKHYKMTWQCWRIGWIL